MGVDNRILKTTQNEIIFFLEMDKVLTIGDF